MVSGAGRCGISFGLGQTALIGKRGSEYGGYRWIETHDLTGEPFWLDYSERSIFSRIVFIDYGYFMIWITMVLYHSGTV